MIDEPPPPVPLPAPAEPQADGRVVIDLLPLAPPPPPECPQPDPDPFHPEIVVCRDTGPSPRIGPSALPEVDDFAIGVPRARVKLSDTAAAEANVINKGVGGFNANGGEVALKIDF